MCLFYSDVVAAQHNQQSDPAATGTTRRVAAAVTTRPWADTGAPPTYPPNLDLSCGVCGVVIS